MECAFHARAAEVRVSAEDRIDLLSAMSDAKQSPLDWFFCMRVRMGVGGWVAEGRADPAEVGLHGVGAVAVHAASAQVALRSLGRYDKKGEKVNVFDCIFGVESVAKARAHVAFQKLLLSVSRHLPPSCLHAGSVACSSTLAH